MKIGKRISCPFTYSYTVVGVLSPLCPCLGAREIATVL